MVVVAVTKPVREQAAAVEGLSILAHRPVVPLAVTEARRITLA